MQLTLTDHGTDVALRATTAVRALQEDVTAPIGGTSSCENRELARTLKTLLGILPTAGGTDENESETMTQTPTLTGSTSNDYVALRVLAVGGPFASPAAFHDYLAGQRQLGLDRPAVAELLAGLEARGLASGTSPDGPGPAQLTVDGAALYARLPETVAPTTSKVLADFDPDDLTTAHRILVQIVERADRLRGEH